jgi:hypothetical protein
MLKKNDLVLYSYLLMVLLFLFCLCYTAVKLEYSLNIFCGVASQEK